MKIVDHILSSLSECITKGEYKPYETDKVEIKDLSTGGDWAELYKSICAFLNAQGGIVIIGIKEYNDKSGYKFTGFNRANEERLKEIPKKFTDEHKHVLDLSEYINPSVFEIRPFLEGEICVIYVEKLEETLKYVFYDGYAYKRKLTGDHKITDVEISRQNELRAELEAARELVEVRSATIADLEIDKLNEFINRLNKEVKVETFKPDIEGAKGFLERKKFIHNNKPTLLGMLVCGKNIYDHVQGRCQVDGFVTSPIAISSNKKVMKDNIIQLMENSIAFVFSNISVEIVVEKGGQSIPEYPERLIRETVNNALAHRDYSVDRFVNITISPGVNIEIRNPGQFKADQLLRLDNEPPVRRIIPIPKPQNPRLADVLKTFDRWEGKGWGMASLTNTALDNQTDLPYYILYSERDIGLVIPKGKILDDEMEMWLDSFNGYILKKTDGYGLTEEQKTVLAYFFKAERLNRRELYTVALTKDNNHFAVIVDLEKYGLIYKHSESPELHPIYLVDRVLTKDVFASELRDIYGEDYEKLPREYKDVINAVYHLNFFGNEEFGPNALKVGEFIYLKKNRIISNVKMYNDFSRKVRKIISWFTGKGYLLRSTEHRPGYKINTGYKRRSSIFDS